MPHTKRLLLLFAAIFVVTSTCTLLQQRSSPEAQRELAVIIPAITAITLYDLDAGDPDHPEALASATSASFPVDVFTRAAATARHRTGMPVWKGSSLAVLTLPDGSQRRARFSYYGGFFTIEGIRGHFSAPEASAPEFQETFTRLIQEHFVPQRRERNRARNA